MKLPTYNELKNNLPATFQHTNFVQKSRQTIKNILNFEDDRLLVIVGPCSIHDRVSAKEFANKLKNLASQISDHCFLVMRTYCEKPRTVTGWKGFLYDPFLDGSTQIAAGIEQTRQLLLDLAFLEVPTAAEFLDPLTANYYEDLISWGSIGARTSSSQIHRQLASSLKMPMGIKNGIAGNISCAIDGIVAVAHPHTFIGINHVGEKSIIRSEGNPDAHIVLRGGESGPNYDANTVNELLTQLNHFKLPARIIIDCSHHNSNKQPLRQIPIFNSVLQQIIKGNRGIRGLMLESHLHADNQSINLSINSLKYGVSVTDPCLDWDKTKELLLNTANILANKTETTLI